jgi:hypothetical protein
MAHRQQLFHQNGKKCPVGNFFDGDGKDSKGKRKINQPTVLLLLLAAAHSLYITTCFVHIKFFFLYSSHHFRLFV